MKSFKEFVAKKSLYIRRNVLNGKDITDHFKKQFPAMDMVPETELHCTIMYSRGKVDWNRIRPMTNTIEINCSYMCGVKRLGDAGAIVQDISYLPEAEQLQKRWKELMAMGCTWQYETGYKPHITLTYVPFELPDNIIPYTGKLILGPEILQELDLNWKDKLTNC